MSTHPYTRWSKALEDATDDTKRRDLLREIALHRARSLGNLPVVRQATWALSQLHASLGERDRAVFEVRSLLSLAGGTPPASDGEVEAARAWMSSLGETPPASRGAAKSNKRNRKNKRDRQSEKGAPAAAPASSRLDDAVHAAAGGRHAEALKMLRGEKGRRAEKLRAWVRIHKVTQATDAKRDALLQDAERWFRERAGARIDRPAERTEEPTSDQPEDAPLVALLGGALPRRRDPLVDRVMAFVDENADRVDEVAAAALTRHLALYGAKRVAPWWIGLVARALTTTDGERTRAVIAEHSEAYAVTAYAEDGFARLAELGRAAVASGWSVSGMRRGVLGRDEPNDRRAWVLHLLDSSGASRSVAWLPPSDEDYPNQDGLSTMLDRMTATYGVVGVEAAGAGNASVRSAAEAAGLCCFEGGDDAEWLETLGARSVPTSDSGPAPSDKRRDAEAALVVALQHDEVTAERLGPPIRAVRRRRTVCQIINRVCGVQDDTRIAAAVDAMVAQWPGDRPLPEVTTLLVSAAAAGGAQCAERLLRGEHAQRLGGDGMAEVVSIAATAVEQGWSVQQVVRGVRRRERENDAGLASFAEPLFGVWRLLLRQGDARGEVWWVSDLPLEGRAGLPLLLLAGEGEPILCIGEADLQGWCADNARGAKLVGWQDADRQDALRSALSSWRSLEGEEVVQVQDDHPDGEQPAHEGDEHHSEE